MAERVADLVERWRHREPEEQCHRSADDLVTAIFAAVGEFTAGENPYDDQTVVVLKVLGESGKKK